MIIGSIANIDIEDISKVKATTWEISKTQDFKQIVARSENDTNNIFSITFPDINLGVGEKLYGRAKLLIEGYGWTIYNNMEIIDVDDEDVITNLSVLPSKISVPRLVTSYTDNKEDVISNTLNHPITNFYLNAKDSFVVVGDSQHVGTSWYIVDKDDNIVWQSLNNINNKEYIKVDNIILEENEIYAARCVFHSNSGDSSPVASFRFKTNTTVNKAVYAYLNNFLNNIKDFSSPINLTIPYDTTIGNITFKILNVVNGYSAEVFNIKLTDGNRNITIPLNRIQQNKLYICMYKTSDTDEFDVVKFSTYN